MAALGAFAYLFILAAAGLFRAENVLSARALTWTRLRAELRTRGSGRPRRAATSALDRHRPRRKPNPVKQSHRPIGRTTDPAGENPRSLFPKRSGPMSTKRLYATYAIAAVVVAIGLVEYLVRKDDTGIVIAIVGLVTALSAYARRPKS